MTNPYDSQSIVNYNTDPPSDDASATEANRVTWAKHKGKLADPVKTLTEAVNAAVLAAFAKLPLYAVNSQATNYTTVLADDRKIIAGSNTITITLIEGASAGVGYSVTVGNAGTGTITIDGNASEQIAGQATIALSRQYEYVTLAWNGTAWDIVYDHRRSYDFAIDEGQGTDIASATTTDIAAATGNYVQVTGTTTITGLGTAQAGARREVEFTGALTLTHNATSLILPGGANITTAAGDTATFISLGSGNWKCAQYTKAANPAGGGAVLGGAMAVLTATFTTTATTPDDNTIPQNTEGAEVMTLAYTPKSATSKLYVEYADFGSAGVTGGAAGRVMHLHRDSDADAIAASYSTLDATGETRTATLGATVDSNATTETTFKVRAGSGGAATVTIASAPSIGDVFGAIAKTYLKVTEVEE